jgi:hypothetical protein
VTTNTVTEKPSPSDGYRDAIALFQIGNFEAAHDILRGCIEAEPNHIGARFGLGMCKVKLGDLAGGERLLRDVIDRDSQHVQAHFELAELYERTDRRAEAIAAYHAILAMQPRNATALRKVSEMEAAASGQRDGRATRPRSSGPRPRTRSTLATELDDDSPLTAAQIAGDVVVPLQRRSLWSHRRLWAGVAMLIYVPLGVLARRRAEELMVQGMSQMPGAPPGVGIPPAPTGAQTFLALFMSLLQLFGYALLVAGVALLIGAFLSSRMSTYVIREHRVEITKGVLFRSRRYIWLYGVRDLEFVQDPLLMLAGTAKIKLLMEDTGAGPVNLKRSPKIIGCGSTAAMRKLYDRLESMVRAERRAMKKAFI